MRRAVVVGAGLAGLAAGLELRDRGFSVEMVERSRLLGGKATSFRVDGVEVDNGQHVHLACCTEFLDFAASVGMADRLYTQPRFEVTVLRRGARPARLRAARLPAPLHLAVSFLSYRALGARAKAEVARALLAARRRPNKGETAAAWLHRHGQGRQALAGFWDPFVVPALNAPLEMVSAEALLFTVRTAFLAGAGAARIGWSTVPLARLAEAAAARLDAVHLRTSVVALLGDARGVHGVRLEPERTLLADAVVLAVPPARLRRILGDPAAYGLEGLDRVVTQPIVDVHLWYDRAVPDLDFAAILESPVQWVFQKGPGYLACSLSAASAAVRLGEAELVERCRAEVEAVVPGLRGARLVRSAATRDPEATFVPAPGLRRPVPGMLAPGLALAGAWTQTGWPATMEAAVRSGRAAARAVDAAMVRERAVA